MEQNMKLNRDSKSKNKMKAPLPPSQMQSLREGQVTNPISSSSHGNLGNLSKNNSNSDKEPPSITQNQQNSQPSNSSSGSGALRKRQPASIKERNSQPPFAGSNENLSEGKHTYINDPFMADRANRIANDTTSNIGGVIPTSNRNNLTNQQLAALAQQQARNARDRKRARAPPPPPRQKIEAINHQNMMNLFSPHQLNQQAARVEGRRDQRGRREIQNPGITRDPNNPHSQSAKSNSPSTNSNNHDLSDLTISSNNRHQTQSSSSNNSQGQAFMRHPAYSSPQYYNSLEKQKRSGNNSSTVQSTLTEERENEREIKNLSPLTNNKGNHASNNHHMKESSPNTNHNHSNSHVASNTRIIQKSESIVRNTNRNPIRDNRRIDNNRRPRPNLNLENNNNNSNSNHDSSGHKNNNNDNKNEDDNKFSNYTDTRIDFV